MVKAILFDFDDTLGNREYAAYNLYHDLLKPYFSDELLLESAVQDTLVTEQYGNCDKNYVQTQIQNRYNVQFDFILKEKWEELIGQYSVPFDDTVDTLEYLKKKYKLGVITNGYTSTQHNKINNVGIAQYFDMILTSQEVGVLKPDPLIFRCAAERLNLNVDECVYVGDVFSNDVFGALRAGMKAVWIWKRGFRQCRYDVQKIETLSDLKKLY
ncbi:MAG: HAD family hydrolase [Erysipelotrichaceae bacterium]|nr:HAD family hydrolase [Erysipelotrichaceae bacterium]